MSSLSDFFRWTKLDDLIDIQIAAYELGRQSKPGHGDLYELSGRDLTDRIHELTFPILRGIPLFDFDKQLTSGELVEFTGSSSTEFTNSSYAEDNLTKLIIAGLFSTPISNADEFKELRYTFNKVNKPKLADFTGIIDGNQETYINGFDPIGEWEDRTFIVCHDALKGAGFSFDTSGDTTIAIPPKHDYF